MKKVLICLLVLGIVAWNAPLRAAELDAQKQAELTEKIKKLEQQIAELTALKLKKQTLPVKREQCMKAVGVESYCTCVVEKLPASVDFRQFVHILLTPAKELGYDSMSADQKQDIDLTLVGWAKCVDYKGPKGSGLIDGIMNRDTLF
jgi:Tfp pilus assembly protein PilN